MTKTDDVIIQAAKDILLRRLRAPGAALTSSIATKDFLRLELAELEHEVFVVIYLDNQHRVIVAEKLFRGTIDGASVYPREVVKEALGHNASAVILAHNHPSGHVEPSHADTRITERLREALGLVDVRVLDHIIVGGMECYSFAENGKL